MMMKPRRVAGDPTTTTTASTASAGAGPSMIIVPTHTPGAKALTDAVVVPTHTPDVVAGATAAESDSSHRERASA